MKRWIKKLVLQAQPSTVLHAGCGKGELTALLVQQNPALAVVGVDPNPEAIAFARAHFHEEAEFLQRSLAQIPFPDDSFDLVICNNALAYVEDPARIVEELKRVSRRHVAMAVPREPYFTWFNRIAQALGATGVPQPLRSWNSTAFQQVIHHHFDEAVIHMKPFQQVADCSVPDDATRVVEKHYGLETLGAYRDCTIAGAYRYEVEPNPRAIYQAYAFKNKVLLFIQVLQMPIPKTERRDPLEIKGNLVRLALRAVIDRFDTGDFEVGEQYDALLLKAGERTASRPRERRAVCEDLAHDDRDSITEKKRHGEPDAVYATSNGSRPEHAAARPSSKIPSAPHSDEEHEAQPRPDDGLKAKNTLPRVLVIDRDSATQYQIRLVLKDLCKTSAAYTGGLAFHYLESQLNVLIITAMELPNGYSGRGLLHAIRAMAGYEHVPVIGMTTTGDRSEDRDDVLRQGFDAYFQKPLDLQALRETVQRLLRVGSTSLVNKMEEE